MRPTIRALDTQARPHTVLLTEETDNISLSGLSLQTVALNALSVVPHKLRDLSLSANSLHAVDLSPLAHCANLVMLTLNSNRITNIDLAPLSSCPKLERIWLHDNKLQTIDLSPLRECTALRSLYLEDNSIHSRTIDLSPLTATTNLRSLRLGGNRLAGKIDLTPLLMCPALSIFNVDTSVTLMADGESSQARVSSALRRIVLDIKFSGKRSPEASGFSRGRTAPPGLPKSMAPSSPRRKVNPPVPPPKRSLSPREIHRAHSPIALPEQLVVKVLLIGFRRLARYAVEDALNKCGSVVIRAADVSIISRDPEKIHQTNVVILYAPSEKALRQLSDTVQGIPTAVTGSERYHSTASSEMSALLKQLNFCTDPISDQETARLYNMGRDQAMAAMAPKGNPVDSTIDVSMPPPVSPLRLSPVSRPFDAEYGNVNIELEPIDDDEDDNTSSELCGTRRPRTSDQLPHTDPACSPKAHGHATTWSEVSRRLRERGGRTGRGWGNYSGGDMSTHGKNKLRAERASLEAGFSDLGGFGSMDTFTAVARACGLPKCAGPLLFRAAYSSSFEIESTTPEGGIPNPPMERKTRRISYDSFLAYWNGRLRAFDGEERLGNILEDSVLSNLDSEDAALGHSQYGAPRSRKSSAHSSPSTSFSHLNHLVPSISADFPRSNKLGGTILPRSASMSSISSDISCPCDAGIESLIRAFMEGRKSRFGAFALVKKSEAIAIGSALVIHALRGKSRNRVGGAARAVCPKEVREGKLNASLIAAEVGIFEGVTCGLSMDQIRSVKGSFATEVSSGCISRSGGIALNCTLGVEDVQRFCISRKTLLPGAVELAMTAHCRNPKRMTLAEFSVLLSVLNNITSHGAVDYMFTVVDVDQDDRWTLPDLRQFHMEKEQMWLQDGMAVSELGDVWVHLVDMIRPSRPSEGITRREFSKLGAKDRKSVIQSLLFMDDDSSLLNIRKTVELNKNSPSPLVVI